MVAPNEIDQNLIDQMVNDYINEVLICNPVLKYTTFFYDYTNSDFYLKVRDQLVPQMYVDMRTGFYRFPTALFLRLNTRTVEYKAKQSKEALFEYFNEQLKCSPEYKTYCERLNHEPKKY